MPAIVTEALTKHFSSDIKAVDGIDLSVEQGRIFAYLGQNGSGKTTTVRVLTTLLRPTGGHAEVDGVDVVRDPGEVRRRIGVALQEAALDDIQTGRELLALQSRLYRIPSAQIKDRVRYLLDIVDLTDSADRTIKTYSGGMKRRLDLAAALVHEPKIVFLDEPTTGLDPIGREAIWRYVSRLNKEEGVTFFLTTQYLEEADRLADEVAILDAGKIVAQGSPEELKATIGTDVVTIRIAGEPEDIARAQRALGTLDRITELESVDSEIRAYIKEGSAAIPEIVIKLNDASVQMREITLARPTLDDVFLRKTGHHLDADEATARQTGAKGA